MKDYYIYIDATKKDKKLVRLYQIEDTKEKIIAEKETNNIVPTIAEILKENNIKITNIKKFTPNTGPGSFTGIKVGVTIANVLNWGLQKASATNLFKPEYGAEPNISKKKIS